MAKLLVIDSKKIRVPFLRGILTRALQDSGLDFSDAYELASTIRQALADRETITTRQLRARVLRHLRRAEHREVIQRYQSPHEPVARIIVQSEDGHAGPVLPSPTPAGAGILRLVLRGGGGYHRGAVRHLTEKRRGSIKSAHLDGLTHACLLQQAGAGGGAALPRVEGFCTRAAGPWCC